MAAVALLVTLTAGCVGIPEHTRAVRDFSLDRYLGRWYEIARLDHAFEHGLDCVTATYSRRDDGGVRVLNRGVHLAEGEASSAEGRAYFVAGDHVGRFKVSFFGPFYGGYNILALDDDRQHGHVLIAGSNRGYLWILARQPRLPAATYERLVAKAAALDFPTRKLVRPRQGAACRPWRQAAVQSADNG